GEEKLDLPAAEFFPREIAFNVVPQCESYDEGSEISTEEEKMEPEIRKMLDDGVIVVHATAVRVPVLVGHSVSLTLSLGREIQTAELVLGISKKKSASQGAGPPKMAVATASSGSGPST